MFAYFRGTPVKKYKDKVILDVNDVGYEIYMPEGDILNLEAGKKTVIYTYTDIKEGYIGIFGFLNEESISIFEKLKKVSGIGSKSAIQILSNMTPSEICISIANEDSTLLNKVPGIGAKTAARIILELKDKILKEGINTNVALTKSIKKTSTESNEAILALKVLGYTTSQITDVMDKLDTENMKVDEIIKKVLANINRRC